VLVVNEALADGMLSFVQRLTFNDEFDREKERQRLNQGAAERLVVKAKRQEEAAEQVAAGTTTETKAAKVAKTSAGDAAAASAADETTSGSVRTGEAVPAKRDQQRKAAVRAPVAKQGLWEANSAPLHQVHVGALTFAPLGVLREVRIYKPRPDFKLGLRMIAPRAGVAGEGIEVVDVRPESPIAQAGVEVGDVLLSVNGATCDALKDGARLLREAEGAVALLILKLN